MDGESDDHAGGDALPDALALPDLIALWSTVPAPAELLARRRPWWRRPIGVAVGLVVVVALVAAAVDVVPDLWAARRYPTEWDPEVAPLARFVERTRGGEFEHPVFIDFVSQAEYARADQEDDADPGGELQGLVDPAEEAEAMAAAEEARQRVVGELRALGYVSGDLDLETAGETLMREGTAAYYDTRSKRVRVKGRRSDLGGAELRVILVHELTHAYDDQHFDLDPPDDALSGERFARRAVLEGSAQLVHWAYIESLPEADRAGVEPDAAAPENVEALAKIEALPSVLVESFGLPYALGPRFLAALRVAMGDPAESPGDAIDRALRKPPTTEAQIADPQRYLAGEGRVDVAVPKLAKGEVRTATGDDDIGLLGWALAFAPHVGADEAWTAVEGWRGDNVAHYRKVEDGPVCLRIAVRLREGRPLLGFVAAAEAWAAALPSTTVRRGTDGGGYVFIESCDPGPEGPAIPPVDPKVAEVGVAHLDLENALGEVGWASEDASCVASAIVERLGTAKTIELFGHDEADAEAAAQVEATFDAGFGRCGLTPEE